MTFSAQFTFSDRVSVIFERAFYRLNVQLQLSLWKLRVRRLVVGRIVFTRAKRFGSGLLFRSLCLSTNSRLRSNLHAPLALSAVRSCGERVQQKGPVRFNRRYWFI